MTRAHGNPSTQFGAITALHGELLLGWAWNPEQPHGRVAVEIFVDGIFVALVRADLAQPEPVVGDGFHGFAARLQAEWLQPGSVVSARLANGGPWLVGDITIQEVPEAHRGIPGGPLPAPAQVWYTGGLTIRGWAWRPDDPAHTVTVAAYLGDRCLAQAAADIWHPIFARHAHPRHGFELDLPWSLADGRTHTLRVVDENGALLPEGELRVCLHPEGLSALVPEPAAYPLLARLARDQDTRYPRTAGFGHYAEWHAQLGTPPALAAVPRGRVRVLLMGKAGPEAEQRSLESLRRQTLPAGQWECADLDAILHPATPELAVPLVPALRELAENCTLLLPLQRGDTLPPHALAQMLHHLGERGLAWGYADCDQTDRHGKRSNPWFKPAWDETLFYGVDLVSPGCAIRSESWLAALDLLAHTSDAPPVHWHGLLAAVIAASEGDVRHIPWVLYHRSALCPASPHLSLPDPARHAAVQWLLRRRTPGAQAISHPRFPGLLQVQWPLPPENELPRVSLIVPTRDQLPLLRTCLDGLLNSTDYPRLEILVVDNDSRHPDTLDYLRRQEEEHSNLRVLRYPHAFNYAAINNWAAAQAGGDILVLINNDIEVLHPDWLKQMVAQMLRPGVGLVGAKLRWPNGMVQHGGVVVGVYGLAAHVGNTLIHSDPGYLGTNQLDRQFSAVTAACMLVHRQLYQRLGGLQEHRYPITFNDVDFCLRVREQGYSVIWSAQAELVHAESASRGKDENPSKRQRARREQAHFRQDWARWNEAGDPFYHPSLAADFAGGPYSGLALPPRPRQNRTFPVTARNRVS